MLEAIGESSDAELMLKCILIVAKKLHLSYN